MSIDRPKSPKRRERITADFLKRLSAGSVQVVGGAGANVTKQGGSICVEQTPQIQRAPFRLMEVQSISNDYVTCKRLYRGATTGGNVMVLKPYELLHDVVYYPQLTVFTTVDAQTATATDGTTTETWAVTPDYAVGQIILVYRLFTDYVDAGSAVAIEWVDLNISGRAWAVA